MNSNVVHSSTMAASVDGMPAPLQPFLCEAPEVSIVNSTVVHEDNHDIVLHTLKVCLRSRIYNTLDEHSTFSVSRGRCLGGVATDYWCLNSLAHGGPILCSSNVPDGRGTPLSIGRKSSLYRPP